MQNKYESIELYKSHQIVGHAFGRIVIVVVTYLVLHFHNRR